MKAIFSLLILIAAFAWIAEPSITFKPFSIKFQSPMNAVGVILLAIGIQFMLYHSNKRAKQSGYKLGVVDGEHKALQYVSELFKKTNSN